MCSRLSGSHTRAMDTLRNTLHLSWKLLTFSAGHANSILQHNQWHPGSLFSHLSCRHGWLNQLLLKIPYILPQCLHYIILMLPKPSTTEPSKLQVTNSAEQRNTKWWSITLDKSKFQMAQETSSTKNQDSFNIYLPFCVPHPYDLLSSVKLKIRYFALSSSIQWKSMGVLE